jgi:hypothetical protein
MQMVARIQPLRQSGYLRRFLATIQSHKAWGWTGLCVYACAVTFPHQQVQDVVGHLAERITLKRLYQASVALALIEGVTLTALFFVYARHLQGKGPRRWLTSYWLLSFAVMVATWRLFTANNTELVHYPQYFPEGVALLALTLSAADSMAWITLFAAFDEGFQYVFLMRGRAAPFDFNDVYMDLAGAAAGIVFAMAVLGCERPITDRSWTKRILTKPGIILNLAIVVSGIALWASGKMALYDAPGSSDYWFSLSRLSTPTFWYFSPVILGPHHFHELSPVEGPILILSTIALFALLDRNLRISSPILAARDRPEFRRK